MYYIFIQENKLNGAGECRQITDGVLNFEVEKPLYDAYTNEPEKYIWDGTSVVENPEYEELVVQKERERLDMLSLTAADVERAIYKAKGMDFEDILDLVKDNPEIDSKALKIELKANNFYRGNPWIDNIGSLLGYSPEDLDYLFENKEFASEEPDE